MKYLRLELSKILSCYYNYEVIKTTVHQVKLSTNSMHIQSFIIWFVKRAHCIFSTVHTAECAASMFRIFVVSKHDTTQDHHHHKKAKLKAAGPNQLRLEWLTTTVSIWGLSRSILQAVQDLSFAHIAVSDQEELEQVVIAFYWAALAAHRVSHLSPGAAEDEDGWL